MFTHLFQTVDAGLVDTLGKERQVVGAFLQQRPEDEFQQRLGQIGIGMQIGKGGFRLDHPELSQVAAGVGVLGAEGWTEGVDFRQRQAVSLDVELTGDGQESPRPKKIPREIDLAPRVRGGLSPSRVLTRNNAPAPRSRWR